MEKITESCEYEWNPNSKARLQQLVKMKSKRIKTIPMDSSSETTKIFSKIICDDKFVEGILVCSQCGNLMRYPSARNGLSNLKRHLDRCKWKVICGIPRSTKSKHPSSKQEKLNINKWKNR